MGKTFTLLLTVLIVLVSASAFSLSTSKGEVGFASKPSLDLLACKSPACGGTTKII